MKGDKNHLCVLQVAISVVRASVSSNVLLTFTFFLPISKVIALLVDLRELCDESKNSEIVSL